MSDDVATTATPAETIPAKQVPVQKYKKASSKSYPTFVEAKTAKDAVKLEKTQRVRIRRRANDTFDVVVYQAIEQAAR